MSSAPTLSCARCRCYSSKEERSLHQAPICMTSCSIRGTRQRSYECSSRRRWVLLSMRPLLLSCMQEKQLQAARNAKAAHAADVDYRQKLQSRILVLEASQTKSSAATVFCQGNSSIQAAMPICNNNSFTCFRQSSTPRNTFKSIQLGSAMGPIGQ